MPLCTPIWYCLVALLTVPLLIHLERLDVVYHVLLHMMRYAVIWEKPDLTVDVATALTHPLHHDITILVVAAPC